MELDPRLQNISAADLQEFGVPHYPNFDQGYQSALYDNGLSEDHAPAHAHAHAQAYAQFVTDANEPAHFDGPGTSPIQHRANNTPTNRTRNVNTQRLSGSPVNTRHGRRIPQHPAVSAAPAAATATVPPPQFARNSFTSPSVAIQKTNPLVQHSPIAHSNSTSPVLQRQSSRTQQPPSQIARSPQTRPQPTPHQVQLPHQQPQPQPQLHSPTTRTTDPSQFTHPSTFPLIPNPPNLASWREKFFNITEPLLLTSEEYHTYFPHVDNIYSHRSTQKYKKKPFVSHYWDCRLKGRPTGTPLSKLRKRQEGKEDADIDNDGPPTTGGAGNDNGDETGDKEVKKRKRKTRERDLCDVKIKVTEFFGRDELEALGKLGIHDQSGDDAVMENVDGGGGDANTTGGNGRMGSNGQLTFVLEDGNSTHNMSVGSVGHRMSTGQGDDAMSFGVLEPMKKLPEGHPGADGKRWYMVQRVNGSGKDDDDTSLDHKHTLEESDRIKKNSVQRWLLAQEKERKKQTRTKNTTDTDGATSSRSVSQASTPSYHASGKASQTAKLHASPVSTQLTFYASSFCPFAQRIWIALELKGIPYQYVEVTPSQIKDGKCTIPGLLEVCSDGIIPLLRHGNWGVWESDIVLEYLEDLSIGHSLLPLGDPQLRAHSRLWKDHINRKVLPYFYGLLLLPNIDGVQAAGDSTKPSITERKSVLISNLQRLITELVNASHATGPFFLGTEMSIVDVAFAPWIIRLSRVLGHYREFPKPEVGTRWKAWVDAVESNDAVRRTVSDDRSYHAVYGIVEKDGGINEQLTKRGVSELRHAQRLVRQEGFGLGGDVWGTLIAAENPVGIVRS